MQSQESLMVQDIGPAQTVTYQQVLSGLQKVLAPAAFGFLDCSATFDDLRALLGRLIIPALLDPEDRLVVRCDQLPTDSVQQVRIGIEKPGIPDLTNHPSLLFSVGGHEPAGDADIVYTSQVPVDVGMRVQVLGNHPVLLNQIDPGEKDTLPGANIYAREGDGLFVPGPRRLVVYGSMANIRDVEQVRNGTRIRLLLFQLEPVKEEE